MIAASKWIASGLVSEGVPLGPLTTYKSGGPARFFSQPSSLDDLSELVGFLRDTGDQVLVVGRGSNLVISDAGFPGLVIHMGAAFNEISYDGLDVTAGAGAPLPIVARRSVSEGVAGLEFFVGVPGSVGGAVHQNAGCFGVEASNRLVEAHIVDMGTGEQFDLTPEELDMSYRHSSVRDSWVVVSARFRGVSDDISNSTEELKEITRWRKENQPGGTLNAGSVFKNPEGKTAGYLIDQAGLKGYSVGGVSVSEKHANFFVATREATSGEIRELILAVRDLVSERAGVLLEPELQLVGFDDVH